MKATNKVQTIDSTTGTGTSTTSTYYTYTDSPPSYKAEKGWECPRCGRINAPWVRQCDCSRNNQKITCDDTIKNEWWKEYTTSDTDTFKIHPYETTYTTAANSTAGGSDYWDNTEKMWSNILKNVSNIKEIY